METFSGRLKLQKTIYLMQSFGLYIGYPFSWYIRGPYSPELTRDGFELREIYDLMPEAHFADPKDEEQFNRFLAFLGEKKDDADWLEIIASIHFLKQLDRNLPKDQIIRKVMSKKSYFTKELCEKGWKYLEEWKMI